MKSFFKSALILTIIAAVSGGLLVGLHKLTYVPYAFELTPADNAAIARLAPDATSFGKIEHDDIKAEPNMRYLLRILDGANADDYLIRSYAIGFGDPGNVETLTLIDSDTNAISGVTIAYVDTVGNNFYGRLEPVMDEILAPYLGKTSIGARGEIPDGAAQATAVDTRNAIFESIKTSINYYASNTAAIKAAEPSEILGLGEAEDPDFERVQKLYPSAKKAYRLGELSTFSVVYFMTDQGDICYDIKVTVSYSAGSESGEYDMWLMFKANGAVLDPTPVPKNHMPDYYDIDGVGGATATYDQVEYARSVLSSMLTTGTFIGFPTSGSIKTHMKTTNGHAFLVSATLDGYTATLGISVDGGEVTNVFVGGISDESKLAELNAAIGGEENGSLSGVEAAKAAALGFGI